MRLEDKSAYIPIKKSNDYPNLIDIINEEQYNNYINGKEKISALMKTNQI